MLLYRPVIPAIRQVRILGGIFYRNTSTFPLYSREAFKSKKIDINRQSVLLPGPERIRASPYADDPTQTYSSIPGSPEVRTVYDLLLYGKEASNDGPCTGTKLPESNSYQWSSYSTVISRTQNIGSGLIELGLQPKNDTFVGIFAANREEFFLTLFSCCGYSMVLVPLYASLGLPSVLYILQHAKLSTVIATNNQNTMSILSNAKNLPLIKTVVTCEKPTEEQLHAAKGANIKMYSFAQVEEIGKNKRRDLVIPDPEDVFCISFTSGTTGNPKGAMLTHKGAIATTASLIYGYGESGKFGGTIISYLPPAHVYELCNEFISLYFARGILFYSGDVRNVVGELKTLKSTILPLVPKIMNGIYIQAMKTIAESKIKSFLLPIALWHKEKLIKRNEATKKTIWDKYLFKDFQDFIGHPHMVFTTSAPVPHYVMRFFVLASGACVHEVYGSTETFAAVMTLSNDPVLGYVGAPMICNHIKLVDVPELDYFSKDDVGEICIKGPNVFKGYLNNPEATNESLKDGWYHTGDVGKWLPNGALKVIDRKKHLFKLSQGEYITPEKVENAYSLCGLVLQIFIDGIPGKDYIVALVVPEPTLLKKWLEAQGHKLTGNLTEILSSKDVRKAFLSELHKYGKKSYLNSLEQARNMAFLFEPMTVDNDLLTPTLKIKRNKARKHFESIFKKLYDEGQIVSSVS